MSMPLPRPEVKVEESPGYSVALGQRYGLLDILSWFTVSKGMRGQWSTN